MMKLRRIEWNKTDKELASSLYTSLGGKEKEERNFQWEFALKEGLKNKEYCYCRGWAGALQNPENMPQHSSSPIAF